MKITVIGGTGLIGSRLVKRLGELGHEMVSASPDSGVDTLTGEGLADALKGADVVVDVSNSPSFEDRAVLDFFTKSATNIRAAEVAAGARHHVALSVVGVDRLVGSGYMRAKVVQERIIKEGPTPFSIVHATQFYEFFKSIARGGTVGDEVHLSPAKIQPMAGDDVAKVVARVAVGAPVNGMIEVAGPVQFQLDEFVAQGLKAHGDMRTVVADPQARYFGVVLADRDLLPGEDAELAATTFEDWLQVDVVSGPKP